MVDCSDAQIMPLSNVLECRMELTATFTSADSSIIAGVLPAPTPSAGLPEEYAALTMPGPPVARMMSASFIAMLVSSSEGTSTHEMMSSGAPAATAASSTTFAAAMVDFFARGWGEMMMPLRVLRQISVLKMAVDVGLVVGMTAATTPIGSATFIMPNASSRSSTPTVCVSL